MKGLAVHVRTAGPDDVDVVRSLATATFVQTFGPDNNPADMEAYVSDAFAPARLAADLADPGSRYFIAEVGGEPAGYANLRAGPAPPCVDGERPIELSRIYVEHRWFGHGVGAALMERCIEEARAAGARTLWLGVWERNERAKSFYGKWGFRHVGEHEFVLGSDVQIDWVMARVL